VTGIVARLWEALTGRSYYSGQQASVERGLPPSVTSGVAYAQVPDELRHELWLRAKATDAAGRAAIAAELAAAGLTPRPGEPPVPRREYPAALRGRGGDRLLSR
jgi:hypothetical protein